MNGVNLDYAYFLAWVPNDEAKRRVLEEYKKLRLRLKLRPDDVFHITLNDLGTGFPFDLPLSTKEAIDRACRAIAAITAPFDIILNQVLSYNHNRALALAPKDAPNPELKVFGRALRAKLREHGVDTSPISSPHLTLLYGEHQVNEPLLPPITWRVEEFVLVRSHQGRTHHDHLQTWKLQGTPGSQATQSEFCLE